MNGHRRAAAIAAGLVVLGAAAPAASAAAQPCVRKGERVQARSAQLVVVAAKPTRGSLGRSDRFVGCWRATGRRVPVTAGWSSRYGGSRLVGPFAVAGTLVAWGSHDLDRYGPRWSQVSVLDLAHAGGGARSSTLPADQPVTEVAVDALGRVAYLTKTTAAVVDGVQPRRADRALPGGLSGLAMEGADATWTHAGQRRRAPLSLAPDGCAVPLGDQLSVSTTEGIVVARSRGTAPGVRSEALACLRSRGEYVSIGDAPAQLAGTIAAAERGAGIGADVVAIDLMTGDQVGTAVAIERHEDTWSLAADGTIVVARGATRRLEAHMPDGRVVGLGRAKSGWNVSPLIDDLTRQVQWGEGSLGRRAALP